MDRLADRIDQAAAALTTMDRRVPELLPVADAFGADDAGRPGRIGQRLHEGWSAVLQARAAEAAVLAARLSEMAHSVRASSQDYAETDAAAQRRLLRGL